MKYNAMKNVFQHIKVSKKEYQSMLKHSPAEKFQYLADIFESHDAIQKDGFSKILGDFFDELTKNLEEDPDDDDDSDRGYFEVESEDIPETHKRVDILIDEDQVLLESNSLKALRHIVYNFFDNGYILSRDLNTEKVFRKDKLTKYLRVYSIIGINPVLCPN
jgi:hypothetical protein